MFSLCLCFTLTALGVPYKLTQDSFSGIDALSVDGLSNGDMVVRDLMGMELAGGGKVEVSGISFDPNKVTGTCAVSDAMQAVCEELSAGEGYLRLGGTKAAAMKDFSKTVFPVYWPFGSTSSHSCGSVAFQPDTHQLLFTSHAPVALHVIDADFTLPNFKNWLTSNSRVLTKVTHNGKNRPLDALGPVVADPHSSNVFLSCELSGEPVVWEINLLSCTVSVDWLNDCSAKLHEMSTFLGSEQIVSLCFTPKNLPSMLYGVTAGDKLLRYNPSNSTDMEWILNGTLGYDLTGCVVNQAGDILVSARNSGLLKVEVDISSPAPLTLVPDTQPPDTPPPDTNPPVTQAPDTLVPTPTVTPATGSPNTSVPLTSPSTTNPPDTHIPSMSTGVPATDIPETDAPDSNNTMVPVTTAPDTKAPTTTVPSVPSTGVPKTTPPSTDAPVNPGPTTPGGVPQGVVFTWGAYQGSPKNGLSVDVVLTGAGSSWPFEKLVELQVVQSLSRRGLQWAVLTFGAANIVRTVRNASVITVIIGPIKEYAADFTEVFVLKIANYTTNEITIERENILESSVGEAANVATGVVSVVSGPAAGAAQQVKLYLDMECGTGKEPNLGPSFHLFYAVFGVLESVGGSKCLGSVFGNLIILASFTGLHVVILFLFARDVTNLRVQGLLKFPSFAIFTMIFVYQPLTLCASRIMLHPMEPWHRAVGCGVMVFAAVAPVGIAYVIYHGVPEKAVYREEPDCGKWKGFVIGHGEWVSRKKADRFADRFTVLLKNFTQERCWFGIFEFGQAFIAGLVMATKQVNYKECGLTRLCCSMLTFGFISLELKFIHQCKQRDVFLDTFRLTFQAVGLLLASMAYFMSNPRHMLMDLAVYLLGFSMLFLLIKVLLDFLTWVYVLKEKRQARLQKEEWKEEETKMALFTGFNEEDDDEMELSLAKTSPCHSSLVSPAEVSGNEKCCNSPLSPSSVGTCPPVFNPYRRQSAGRGLPPVPRVASITPPCRKQSTVSQQRNANMVSPLAWDELLYDVSQEGGDAWTEMADDVSMSCRLPPVVSPKAGRRASFTPQNTNMSFASNVAV
eukprot:TRINITY_DN17094_c0_g1_i1.p1 TRINITY_DN17094_c0_g1~~TRINITY_DN17094_c0_g1_i1.p1  ORF type:complete len:1088 (+),score=143.76 TRINITY_DN17094_c0_g1_i1:49-3264(+)